MNTTRNKNKVVIGMSGGVDSAVSAYLLQKQGYEVVGVNFVMFGDILPNPDLYAIAKFLGIKVYRVDLRKNFFINVIHKFIHSYCVGITPNPCIMCNKCIKFSRLLTIADYVNAEYIATGHYAKIAEKHGILQLCEPFDEKKNQTYFLYNLTQAIMRRTLFPLADMTKVEVRELGDKIGIPVAQKKDSQEICFVPGDNIANVIPPEMCVPGDIVDKCGNVLGKHNGIALCTIGMRRGLNVALGERKYVTELDADHNKVILGDNDDLFTATAYISEINIIHDSYKDITECQAMPRYSKNKAVCTVEYRDNYQTAKVTFAEKQRALTKGQSIVFYKDGIVLGGGVIYRTQ